MNTLGKGNLITTNYSRRTRSPLGKRPIKSLVTASLSHALVLDLATLRMLFSRRVQVCCIFRRFQTTEGNDIRK